MIDQFDQLIADANKPVTLATHFRAMADRLDKNADQKFGGAYVIIPPGATEPISVLVMDSKEDPAAFFNLLKWRIEQTLADIDAEERRRAGGFGR